MIQPLPPSDLEHVLTLAGPDLAALDGARLFLTGGTGFIGRWLVESWASARRQQRIHGELHLLSRDPEAWRQACPHLARQEELRIHAGDQGSFVFPEGPFDGVIHGAVEHGSPSHTFLANLEGTRRTLAFARAAGASRFLMLSSGAVYGIQPPALERLPECHPGAPDPLLPASAYGLMKRASEFLAAEASRSGGPACILARAFAFSGPGLPLDRNYALGNFLRDALSTGPIRIEGDGTPYRSYLYAADLAVWLWTLLVRGAGGRAYNVGSPEALSIRELAEQVRDALCPGRSVTIAVPPDPSRAPARYVPDTTRAEQELGLKVHIPLEEGILRTGRWLREGAGPWA